MRALRRARPDCTIRVDGNQGLTLAEAEALAAELGAIGGVDLLEEPLRDPTPESLGRLHALSPVPIFADESVQGAAEVFALAGRIGGVNLKLAKVGGLAALREAIAVARTGGLQVMLGCMVESSLGVTACAHLAPLADHLDLDGPLLLARDPFVGVGLAGGRLTLPGAPGLGVERRDRA